MKARNISTKGEEEGEEKSDRRGGREMKQRKRQGVWGTTCDLP